MPDINQESQETQSAIQRLGAIQIAYLANQTDTQALSAEVDTLNSQIQDLLTQLANSDQSTLQALIDGLQSQLNVVTDENTNLGLLLDQLQGGVTSTGDAVQV